ncbi:MAG TPA: hypothetical protein VMP01_08940 [Pirellulaceae bacterium]|nr:hypothetical protein [Pirellulaceae bacterium]
MITSRERTRIRSILSQLAAIIRRQLERPGGTVEDLQALCRATREGLELARMADIAPDDVMPIVEARADVLRRSRNCIVTYRKPRKGRR